LSHPGARAGLLVAAGRIARVTSEAPGEQETSASAEEETGGRWPLEGLFTCASGLLVVPECLGQSFQTRTAAYELTITLPELDAPDALAPLRRPPWKFNPEGVAPTALVDEDWGTVASGRRMNRDGTWPAYNAEVRQCIVATTVEAGNDEQFREAARVFAGELAAWWASVTDWLGVLTTQDFVGLGTQRRSILSDGFHAWSGDANGIRRASTGSAVGVVPGHVEPLDRDQLQRAFDLAASEQHAPAEWLFIRDARSLLRARDYRRAVLDAGAASELAMGKLIRTHLDGKNVEESVKKALRQRYRALEGNTDLLRQLRPDLLPDQIKDDLIKPRNTAGHGGNSLTYAQAQKAIETATEVVEHAYPLADF
jgi:HEPN domain-containing protein